jgi:hypothetical protein
MGSMATAVFARTDVSRETLAFCRQIGQEAWLFGASGPILSCSGEWFRCQSDLWTGGSVPAEQKS